MAPPMGGLAPFSRTATREQRSDPAALPRLRSRQQSKARHPAGDRSQHPPNAQELVGILERDMQRVASKAPAS